MEKRIVIAVDDSFYSRQAIKYAAGMGAIAKDLNYTLLNVQPKISDFLLEDARTDSKAKSALKDVTAKNQENSFRILDDLKGVMVKSGIDKSRIETVSQQQHMGTSKTILDYAEQSLCDAIVLGKRGMSRLAEAFIGSITNSVLEHSKITPVWAVGGKTESSKIMVAIDGSESALRAVDHVSFMIRDSAETEITLLHVTPRLRDYCTIEFDEKGDIIREFIAKGDKQCIDDFYAHAKKIFEDAGIEESRIDIKEVKSTVNIGKTIVDEAEKDKVGTLVVGTRGMNNSFFVGKVSRNVLRNAKDCAVWLVP